MIENAIIYEQPLNELIRVCLRLEQLFAQIDHLITDTSKLGTRNIVSIIINILHLLDRPDLKAKLAKELGRLQLDELSRCFIDSNGKIAQNLRDVELLNNLRLHLTSPGGGCSFDIPLYHYWIEQPLQVRQETIASWLTEFNSIRKSTSIILQLVRERMQTTLKSAVNGFYQEMLDPQLNLKLIRVGIQPDIAAYPEISVGRHFLSVRFYSPHMKERPTQFTDNLSFWLAYGN